MTRLLPIDTATDIVRLALEVGGSPLPGHVLVQSVEILRQINRIPFARLRIADGDPSAATFATSSEAYFVPGREVVVSAGYHGSSEIVFKGIVVKQRIGVRSVGSWLEVEVRDVASRMTLSRRHRYFEQESDSAIVERIVGEYGIDSDIAPTDFEHDQLVQYQATDWDFIISRVEANGHFCAVEDGTIRTFVPSLDESSNATVEFGTNLLEFDAECDARRQVETITSLAWDPASQELRQIEASDPGWELNSNLTVQDLVEATGRESDRVPHGGHLSNDALQAWADGRLLRSRISGSRGRARFRGFPELRLGQSIALGGLGDRFNGDVLITGIRHEFANGDWCTDVEFGAEDECHSQQFDVNSIPASGFVPAVSGLQSGIVTALAGDPASEHRIRVKIPVSGMDQEGVWARLATLDAGNGRGTFIRPEVDDEVVVGFLDDDPTHPVILGMLHSSAHPPPDEASNENDRKGYTSREKLQLVFDDSKPEIALKTPAKNVLLLSDGEGGIELTDQNGNSLKMSTGGIELSSDGNITINAGGDVSIDCSSTNMKSQLDFKAEASKSAELSSSGTLTVAGTLVRIN